MYFFFLPIRVILFGLFVFFLSRFALYWTYQDYFSSLTFNDLFLSLLKGVQFDASIMVLALSPLLLLISLPFKWIYHGKISKIALIVMHIICLAMFAFSLADLFYFGEVQRHIGADVFNLSSDLQSMLKIGFSSRLLDIFIIALSLVVVSLIWYPFVFKHNAIRLPKSLALKLLSCICLIALYVISVRGFVLQGRPINLSDAFTGSKIEQANLTLNPVYVAYKEIKNRENQQPLQFLSPSEMDKLKTRYPDVFHWQHKDNQPTGKNVVIILLESWSYRYIDSLAGGNYKVTPFMDSLVQKSMVWDNYYAAGQRSIIGIQAILSSMPSLQNYPTLGFGLEMKNMSRIANIANRHNYFTLMMQSSARRSFHMENIAKILGFQEYYGKEDIPILRKYPQEQPPFGWDYDALQFLKNRLNKVKDKPFFAFLFTGTTHEPFPKLDPEFEIYPHESKGENGFLNALHYSDWSVQQFMQEAEKQDWYKNTVFIFTADHTLNAKTKSKGDVAEQFHIPLVIFSPDGSLPAQRVDTLASQYDLFPSVMDLLGFNDPIHTFGKSLFSQETNDSVMLNRGDVVGVLYPQKNWLTFTNQGVQSSSEPVSETMQQDLEMMQFKMQYADELLQQNRWFSEK